MRRPHIQRECTRIVIGFKNGVKVRCESGKNNDGQIWAEQTSLTDAPLKEISGRVVTRFLDQKNFDDRAP